jgi:ATP-dependent DNA helicase RecQ
VTGVQRSPSDPTFQRLRALRSRLAERDDVPAYMVFADRVLWDMIEGRPVSRSEMARISGVSPAKLERYGDAFLEALRSED